MGTNKINFFGVAFLAATSLASLTACDGLTEDDTNKAYGNTKVSVF